MFLCLCSSTSGPLYLQVTCIKSSPLSSWLIKNHFSLFFLVSSCRFVVSVSVRTPCCPPSPPSLCFSSCSFGSCVCVSENHSTRSVEQKNKTKSSPIVARFLHTAHLERMQRPRADRNKKRRKGNAGLCLCETSELSCRDGEAEKQTSFFSTSKLGIHCCTC